MSCSICSERFTLPVSLPCGHVFCRECICRTVDSVQSSSLQHFCPSCQKAYCIVSVDPALIPPYLRAHIQAPIRPLFFDDDFSPTASEHFQPDSRSQSQSQPDLQSQSQSQPDLQFQSELSQPLHTPGFSSPPSTPPQSSPELGSPAHGRGILIPSPNGAESSQRTSVELGLFPESQTNESIPTAAAPNAPTIPTGSTTNETTSESNPDLGDFTAAAAIDALRLSCATWRRRAEVHTAANAGLLAFARAAKECTVRMRGERDRARSECVLLKRKLAEVVSGRESERKGAGVESSVQSRQTQYAQGHISVSRSRPSHGRGLPVFVTQQKKAIASGASAFPGYDERTQSRFGPPLKRRRTSDSCGLESGVSFGMGLGRGASVVASQ